MIGSGLPDKRLLWHPRQDNKFVVGGGSQITLYEWAPDYPEIRHITSQHDLQFMKVSITDYGTEASMNLYFAIEASQTLRRFNFNAQIDITK